MRSLGRPLALLVMLSCGGILVGCSNQSQNQPPVSVEELDQMHVDEGHGEHDGESAHHHASTYPEIVAELEVLRGQIRDAFAAGNPESADADVHAVGHALEDVNGLAKKASLGDEDLQAVDGAVQSLFDAFGQIDEKLHGGVGADYDEVAKEIDVGLAILHKHVMEPK